MIGEPGTDKTNNHVSNLRWDTRKSNHADKLRHGTVRTGDKHPNAKLTAEKVAAIRKLAAEGFVKTHIAGWFGVCPTVVTKITKRKAWKHVP